MVVWSIEKWKNDRMDYYNAKIHIWQYLMIYMLWYKKVYSCNENEKQKAKLKKLKIAVNKLENIEQKIIKKQQKVHRLIINSCAQKNHLAYIEQTKTIYIQMNDYKFAQILKWI